MIIRLEDLEVLHFAHLKTQKMQMRLRNEQMAWKLTAEESEWISQSPKEHIHRHPESTWDDQLIQNVEVTTERGSHMMVETAVNVVTVVVVVVIGTVDHHPHITDVHHHHITDVHHPLTTDDATPDHGPDLILDHQDDIKLIQSQCEC